MPSPAAKAYKSISARSTIILRADRSSLARADVQSLYGASFVAQVAAWNTYAPALVGCFFQEVSNPAHASFHAMHTIANGAAKSYIERFNTPNTENTRNLIVACTGYDPLTDWQWPARGLTVLAVRTRLNEILKVRHSFAHGFTMPGVGWNQATSGEIRLTLDILQWTRLFLNHLVAATDAGLKRHLVVVHGVAPTW